LGIASQGGTNLQRLKDAIGSGQIKALISLGENPLHCGITGESLERLPVYIVMDILSNEATRYASIVLPSLGFAEKRGSMINRKGRLQRLNRAVRGPGLARDDWEILRDLIQDISGGNGIYTIEDVFRQMSEATPELAGLTLSRISDFGVQVLDLKDTSGASSEKEMREPEKRPQ
jgi:predicted molibdopterin-dependent oxidoreductase YjgC